MNRTCSSTRRSTNTWSRSITRRRSLTFRRTRCRSSPRMSSSSSIRRSSQNPNPLWSRLSNNHRIATFSGTTSRRRKPTSSDSRSNAHYISVRRWRRRLKARLQRCMALLSMDCTETFRRIAMNKCSSARPSPRISKKARESSVPTTLNCRRSTKINSDPRSTSQSMWSKSSTRRRSSSISSKESNRKLDRRVPKGSSRNCWIRTKRNSHGVEL